ncbi:ABC transporter permease subunit [Tumebacillus permanentifrigoris]|uniref:ABC-type dipeptide/oligopeptide/nickel transport system permease subunit n=1 Tax=Tumebacillus permanentifrigoris TaxID=378543 RepID=A0A316D676_9BACL|nr:ABC transporter permease subunit [Tumebacillus permanentifrigoris]PWK07934.1 ABC-type dipeptide/oligopeptide/nickel transport system permease subunit [Tumebacillus permanentifrigoris]
MKQVGKVISLLLAVCLGLLLFSNLDKGFIKYEQDVLQVIVRPGMALGDMTSNFSGIQVLDVEKGLVAIPYGAVDDLQEQLQRLPGVKQVEKVTVKPHYSLKKLLYSIKQQVMQYAKGEFGGLSYKSRPERVYDISGQLMVLLTRSLGYLLAGLGLGVVCSLGLVVLGAWKPRLGKWFDGVHALLFGIPDFFMVTLFQFGAIMIAKRTGYKVFSIMQFSDDIPFVIPMLSIAILPGILLYGVVRLAIEREWEQSYVRTAYSKGLSKSKVLFHHILRNTYPDLLAVLPRTIALSITSLLVAEVMCGIFGLGGYAVNKDLVRVTSLTTTCAILSVVVITAHIVSFVMQRKFSIKHEGGAISATKKPYSRKDSLLYGLSWIAFSLLVFVIVAGGWLMPHTIGTGDRIQWITEQVDGVVKYVTPPFAPSSRHWLGTDHRGLDVLSLLVNGARYTFGFALCVTVLRLLIGVPMGMWSGLTGKGKEPLAWMNIITSSVPSLLLVFPVLYGLSQQGLGFQSIGESGGVLFSVILICLLVFLGVFQIAGQFSARAQFYRDSLYIDSARTMGSSTWRIMRVHLVPQLRLELIYAAIVELVQVLFVMGQLAVLGFFFGGGEMFGVGEGNFFPLTTTGEWGGMIAYGVRVIRSYPWIILSAGAAMTLTILCLMFFSNQMQRRFEYPRIQPAKNPYRFMEPRMLTTAGVTISICMLIVITLKMPSTMSEKLTSQVPPTLENVPSIPSAEPSAKQVEDFKVGCRNVAEGFLRYLIQGKWDMASSYIMDGSQDISKPVKPFDAWMTAFTDRGYQLVRIGGVPEIPKGKSMYQGVELEISVLDKNGQSEVWVLQVDNHYVIAGREEPK